MLLAVEGGGFFSSSANGYSTGLTLLFLGQKKNKEEPMRVLPWNQYQLVDQYPESDLQLASTEKRLSCRCASFVCFRRCSAGLEVPSPLKVDSTQQQDVITDLPVSDNGKYNISDKSNATEVILKSRLKKSLNSTPIATEEGRDLDIVGQTERRKVQWTDACGKELVEIREFEPSEADGSDDEFENGIKRRCSCSIM